MEYLCATKSARRCRSWRNCVQPKQSSFFYGHFLDPFSGSYIPVLVELLPGIAVLASLREPHYLRGGRRCMSSASRQDHRAVPLAGKRSSEGS